MPFWRVFPLNLNALPYCSGTELQKMRIERIIRTHSKYQKMAKRSVEAFKRLALPWNKVIFGSMSSTCIKCDTSLFECASSISEFGKISFKTTPSLSKNDGYWTLDVSGAASYKNHSCPSVCSSVRPSVKVFSRLDC